MSKKPSIIISDRLYVPLKHVQDKKALREEYTRRIYDTQMCKKCPYLEDRHSYMCDECSGYLEKIRLHNKVEIDGRFYIGLPRGDRLRLGEVTGLDLSKFKIEDQRVRAPFTVDWKFLLTLYPQQEKVLEQFMRRKFGLLESPPRSGKTAMALAIAHRLGQRTVILADQHDFLKQFEYHITGHKASQIPKCTNLERLQDKLGVMLYGTPVTKEDWKTVQIALLTYQQFINEKSGQKRLDMLIPNVGTVIVDEVHSAAANCFSNVIARIPAKHHVGVTGTVDRKDGKQWVIKKVIGPVVARSTVESMTPTVYVHETGFKPKRAYNKGGKAAWVYAMQALARDKKRNLMIAKRAIKDVEAGESVVIPLAYRKHITEIQNLINKLAGERICEVFVGGGGKRNKEQRERVLSMAKSGEAKVIVGIRRLLQRGLNVPRWSVIYTAMPISNRPNYKQETSRIRTPFAGKQPKIRIFVDQNLGQSLGCAKSCIADCRFFKYDFATTPKQVDLVNELTKKTRSAKAAEEREVLFRL